jgi:hypothetical protein
MPAFIFDENNIHYWASRYDYPGDAEVEAAARENKKHGFLTSEEFLELRKWKTPRSRKLCERNSGDLIREATGIALSAHCEELRIGTLLVLNGVSWPTASVILHFWHKDPYPILDLRALWSIGWDEPSTYTFDFWLKYTEFCRKMTKRNNVRMRILDRALWQYSSENQPKTIGSGT